jgi:small subunit ribosomal protein S13
VWVALSKIYGIGQSTGKSICDQLTISRNTRLKDLSEAKIVELSQLLNKMTIEAELKRKVRDNIVNLVQIGCYRGKRHQAGLPVHGQKTQYNAKTARKLNGRALAKEYHTQAIARPSLSLGLTWFNFAHKTLRTLIR